MLALVISDCLPNQRARFGSEGDSFLIVAGDFLALGETQAYHCIENPACQR